MAYWGFSGAKAAHSVSLYLEKLPELRLGGNADIRSRFWHHLSEGVIEVVLRAGLGWYPMCLCDLSGGIHFNTWMIWFCNSDFEKCWLWSVFLVLFHWDIRHLFVLVILIDQTDFPCRCRPDKKDYLCFVSFSSHLENVFINSVCLPSSPSWRQLITQFIRRGWIGQKLKRHYKPFEF